jgi:hypothetical protein
LGRLAIETVKPLLLVVAAQLRPGLLGEDGVELPVPELDAVKLSCLAEPFGAVGRDGFK